MSDGVKIVPADNPFDTVTAAAVTPARVETPVTWSAVAVSDEVNIFAAVTPTETSTKRTPILPANEAFCPSTTSEVVLTFAADNPVDTVTV